MRGLVRVRTVLELGCGLFSTPLFLDRSVFPEVTRVDSLENDAQWAAKVASAFGSDPRLAVHYVEGPIGDRVAAMDLAEYDVILINDSSSEAERAQTIRAVAQDAPRGPSSPSTISR